MVKAWCVGLILAGIVRAADIARTPDIDKLPIVFEPNQGQADPQVRFLARGAAYALYLTDREAVLALKDATPVRMSPIGASTPKTCQALDQTKGISNYFIGNDPAKWRTKIPNFRRVKCTDVYPGVDLVYYGDGGKLEYDLVVAPGADASRIKIAYQGVESLRVDQNGDLLLKTSAGELRQQRPKVYQQQDGKEVEVAARYRVRRGNKATFELARYDRSKQLVIDPILVYSTYVGGSNTDIGYAIAVSPNENANAVITGVTYSTDFPLTNPFQTTGNSINGKAFVTSIDEYTTREYSTYLGGSGMNQGLGIAVDSNYNAYVTGWTSSTDFPTANPLQATNGGGDDAFVVELNGSGSGLVFSTYLGGSGNDQANGIALAADGSVYVTGQTSSNNFPTASPIQPSFGGGSFDAFITGINASGSAMLYSTYLGGSATDYATGVAVDNYDNAYVTGVTASTDFPTTSALQPANGGAPFDAFVTKIYAGGSALIYSTYLGGSGDDRGQAIAVDANGNMYVAGQTSSTDFPTVNPFQASNAGGSSDAFVAKINASGSAKVYSTYLGGSAADSAASIAVDSAGIAYVAGTTASPDFPILYAWQYTYGGGSSDGFITRINANGFKSYATFLGGSGLDKIFGIALHGGSADQFYMFLDGTFVDNYLDDHIWVTGTTTSLNFPSQAVFGGFLEQTGNNGGGGDAFVTSIFASTSPHFTGSGYGELAVFVPQDGRWATLPPSGPSITEFFGMPGDVPLVGDFDGDGLLDLAVWRPSDSTFNIVPSSTGVPISVNWGLSGDIPVPADYDGDGKTDLAVWRPSNQTWYVIPSSDPSAPLSVTWGIAGDVPVQGDFDGDGRKDFAIWRPSTSTWYVLPSSNPSGAYGFSFGLAGDQPVPGDFDGDGTTDFAVWRPSNGTWYFIPSSLGSVITIPWGIPGDMPMLLDYDGDHKTDFVVYRPSEKLWYTLGIDISEYAQGYGAPNEIPIYRPWPWQ